MKLNESKTDVLMVYSARSRLDPLPLPLAVGNEQICPVSSVRNLGFIFDCHMSFEAQIRSTRQRCYFHLRRIARLRPFLSYSATTKLITGLVFPILDYGNSLLAGLPEKNISQLQLVQNSAARLATKTSRFQSISPVLARLHWLPVKQRIDFKIATLVFKWFSGCAPSYFSELLSLTSSTRLASGRLLHIPLSRKRNFGDRCFSIYAPKIWNALPSPVRNADSFSSFRSLLKTILFRAAFLM
jgi:hypothetical protein